MNIGVIGKSGEDRVAAFLRKNGFSVIKRNYQCRFGEIDIIAQNSEYIIFVEVKTRNKDFLVSPAEAVDSAKQKRIMLTAEDYISNTFCDLQPRFDVAEVIVSKGDDGRISFNLNYIENAF